MSRLVLDASVALSWFIDRPIAPGALRAKQFLAKGGRAVVPALWRVEVANGLVVAERRKLVTSSETAMVLQQYEMLLSQSIDSVHDPIHMQRIVATARQFQLTAYDACYLELAQELHLPLATLDHRLAEAAALAGAGSFS